MLRWCTDRHADRCIKDHARCIHVAPNSKTPGSVSFLPSFLSITLGRSPANYEVEKHGIVDYQMDSLACCVSIQTDRLN